MWRILRFLWTGSWKIPEPTKHCKHKWEMIQEIEVWNPNESKKTGSRPQSIKYLMQCNKCGELKTKEL